MTVPNIVTINIVGPKGVGKTALGLAIETALCQLGLGAITAEFNPPMTHSSMDSLEENVYNILHQNKVKIVIQEICLRNENV